MRLTLRARLALWAALATGVAVVLVAAGLYFSVNDLLRRAQIERLQSSVSGLQARLEDELRRQPDAPLLGYSLSAGLLERVADADPNTRNVELRVLVSQGGAWAVVASTPRFPAGLGVPGDPRRADIFVEGQHLTLLRPLLRGQAVMQVASDARVLGDAQRAFTGALTALVPLALLLSLLIGWTVAGRLLGPVRALEGAARAVGEGGDLRRALPGAGEGDELSRLALTLQNSFGRLADAREREQSFLRAAAHDLRSPLAALTARVEGTLARERDPARYRSELREIGTDITRLSTLANHLLLLARESSALGRAPVALRDLAAEAVDRARELSPEADVDLIAPQAVTVQGDRVLLGQAVWNLTMNALRHAPGATVTVTVEAGEGGEEGRAGGQVTVRDDGPGVDAATLARLGEAFFRPDESRHGDGHGLGLALARRAAELHGGVLELHSRPGAGFSATLRLPATPPAFATLDGNEPH